MKRLMKILIVQKSRLSPHFLLFLSCIFILSCGDSYVGDSDNIDSTTASYIFSLRWPGDVTTTETTSELSRQVVCGTGPTGIYYIAPLFLSSNDSLHYEPPNDFLCTDGSGRVNGLPPGSNVTLWVTGQNSSGAPLYQGEQAGINLVAGKVAQGGEIEMNECIPENCYDGVDNDCDRDTDLDDSDCPCTDSDSDTYYAESWCGTAVDCDDSDANEHPDQMWYKDADGDSYSDSTTDSQSCERPVNYFIASELVASSGDCNDNDENIYPGATEICDDSQDNDCDGSVDGDDTECESQSSGLVWDEGNWDDTNWQ